MAVGTGIQRRIGMSSTATAQRAIFVIGAGRSGTSTLTRALMALGVDLGDHFKRASRKNPTGFFEDADLLAISKSVRRQLGLRADSLRLVNAAAFDPVALKPLHDQAITVIEQRFGDCPIWGFKYGRTLRILPFWQQVVDTLGHDPAYMIALRNPLSVARSRAKIDSRRGRQAISDLEWLVSIVPMLRRCRGNTLVVADYDDLMDQPQAELSRIKTALQLPGSEAELEAFVSAFLRTDLRHSRFDDASLDDAEDLNPLVRDGYRLLRRWGQGQITETAFWEAWTAIEQGVAALAPILAVMDAREQERRRAMLHPLGPLQGLALLKPWFKN
jgi:hypothetical protein